jgi:hypothetical protein
MDDELPGFPGKINGKGSEVSHSSLMMVK